MTDHTPTFTETVHLFRPAHLWSCACGATAYAMSSDRAGAEAAHQRHIDDWEATAHMAANPTVLTEPHRIEIECDSGLFRVASHRLSLVIHPDGSVTWSSASVGVAPPVIPAEGAE